MASMVDDELSNDYENLKLDTSSKVPIRANHRIRDITQEFATASKSLEIGQLVKDDTFSLFDSVQALEIMDPKMDTGLLQPGETLDDYYDVSRELLPAEVVWIMDQLLCYEMAWHQGYPLAQNLLTSVYIYNLLAQDRLPNAMPFFRPLDGSSREPGPLVQKVLRAFCIGIIKSCDVVIEIIQTQQYYEEEDFNTHTFGLNLLTDIPDEEFFEINSDAIQWLNDPKVERSMSEELGGALLSRLSCREHFMRLILPAGSQQAAIDAETFRALAMSFGLERSELCRQPVEEAFSGKLQRRLASTVPPRPIITLDITTASAQLCKMYKDLEEAVRVDKFERDTDFDTLSVFLWAFSAREPSTFARAVLQMFLFNEGKVAGPGDGIQSVLIATLRHHLIDSNCIQESFWTVETPTDPRFQVARAIDFFLEQAAPEYTNVLRSLSLNRCRIRRCLNNAAKDVDNLGKDFARFAAETDAGVPTEFFFSYMKKFLYETIRLLLMQSIQWAVELGFEQDVYQPCEFAGMQHYLAKIGQQRSEVNSGLRIQTQSHKAEITRITRNPLKMKSKNEPDTEAIWQGLSMLYAVLTRLGAIPPAKTPYCTAQSQFELRMRPFAFLSHGVDFTFASFAHAATQETEPLGALLAVSAEKLLNVRQRISAARKSPWRAALEEEEDLLAAGSTRDSAAYGVEAEKAKLKACVRASVAVETLKRALEAAGDDETRLKGRVSVTFETPKLDTFWLVPSIAVK